MVDRRVGIVRGGRWAIASIVVIACAVGGITVARSFSLRSDEAQARRAHEQDGDEAIREGQRAFRSVEMIPLASISSVEEMREHIVGVGMVTPKGAAVAGGGESARERELLRLAADFIYYRFVQGSPEVYRAWRQSSGYRLKDAETMKQEGIARDYEHWFGEPYPGDDRMQEVFDRLWVKTLEVRDASSRPVRIARDAAGVEVSLGKLDRTLQLPAPLLSGKFTERVWHGARSGQLGRDWWRDPNDGVRRELGRRAGVAVGVVGVIVEMKAGDRYPFAFTFYQDADGDWWLWRVNVMNFPMDRFVQLEF